MEGASSVSLRTSRAAMAALTTVAATAAMLVLMPAAGAAASATATATVTVTELCAPDAVRDGTNIVMNNVWGAATSQCIAFEGAEWQVTHSDHNNRGARPAAYPATYYGCHWSGICSSQSSTLPVPVYQVSRAPASWSFAGGSGSDVWSAAFDLWFHTDSQLRRPPDGAEIMIWLDRAGRARPAGTRVASNVDINGITWHVYLAQRPGWELVTYLRSTPIDAVTDFDLNAFVLDARARGHIDPSWFWSAAEAGFVLWRGGTGLSSGNFQFRTQDDPTRADHLPLPPPVPPPGPPEPGTCSPLITDLRRSTGSYVLQPVTIVSGSVLRDYTVTFTQLPGHSIEGWWNADLSFDGDTVTVRPIRISGPTGEAVVSHFGLHGTVPPDEGLRSFGYLTCHPELADPAASG